MKAFWRRHTAPTIDAKLTRIITAASALAVICACLSFIVYDVVTFRTSVARDLGVQAEIVGQNASAALQFGDTQSLQDILETFSAEPQITTAYVFGLDATLNGQYVQPGTVPPPPIYPEELGYEFRNGVLEICTPVRDADGEIVGRMFLQHNLANYRAQLRTYFQISILVMVLSLLVAILVSSRFKRSVTEPIEQLTTVTRKVSGEQDYSLRATRTTDDEIGWLVEDFNRMLAEIQVRDAELARTNQHLEDMVSQRTAELREAYEEVEAAKTRVEAADQLKAALLDNMTHEFRTPIAGIQGIAHILMEELEGEHRELVGLIHESGQRLLDTLMTVLVMAKLEAGSVEHRPRTVAIGPLMEELVQPFRKKAATLGLSLRMATEPLEARLDPNCLDLLLRPLLNNAIKFTEEGHVSVSLRRRGPMLVLEVADTGIGIGATFLPRLFEPFEQESEGLRRTHEGTGLGLAIVHRTARLMGATVSVSSTPGVGTTFTVDLPGSVALDPDALTPVSQTRALS